jgi:hypothetical protein
LKIYLVTNLYFITLLIDYGLRELLLPTSDNIDHYALSFGYQILLDPTKHYSSTLISNIYHTEFNHHCGCIYQCRNRRILIDINICDYHKNPTLWFSNIINKLQSLMISLCINNIRIPKPLIAKIITYIRNS